MTYITEYLENEAGIQNNGVTILNDQKIELQVSGLVIGQFKRGRFDRPMKITSANVRGTLGHDPRNPWYQIIVDAIDAGVPSIEVLRIPGNYYNYEDVEPEPIWQPWQLDQEISINSNMARYTASQTNGKQLASSYAEIDLIAALVRSFADIDMQQWQAVKDAANQLTGVNDWVLDPANNRVKYYEKVSTGKYGWAEVNNDTDPKHISATLACQFYASKLKRTYARTNQFSDRNAFCYDVKNDLYVQLSRTSQPPIVEEQERYLPLDVVAQKVISNAESLDQGISLLAETYIETVAKSIFNSDQSKQFVKQDDLVSQFEENKVIENL